MRNRLIDERSGESLVAVRFSMESWVSASRRGGLETVVGGVAALISGS